MAKKRQKSGVKALPKPLPKFDLDEEETYDPAEDILALQQELEDEEREEQEFENLRNMHLRGPQAAVDEEDDNLSEEGGDGIAQSNDATQWGDEDVSVARDAWGRNTEDFYVHDSELSSESDNDDEGDDEFEQQLQEAKQIREQHLSQLYLEELNAGMKDFLPQSTEGEGGSGEGVVTDDLVTLQLILGKHHGTQKKKVQSLPSALRKEFVTAYRKLCSDVHEESQAYLVCRSHKIKLPNLTTGAIAFLDFQLRLCLWFTVVLQTCKLFESDLPPCVLSMASFVMKATKKLQKIRREYGEQEWQRLRRLLKLKLSQLDQNESESNASPIGNAEMASDDIMADVSTDTSQGQPITKAMSRAERARLILEEQEREKQRALLETLQNALGTSEGIAASRGHLSSSGKHSDGSEDDGDLGLGGSELDESPQKSKRADKKKNKLDSTKKKAKIVLPSLPKEAEGPREITREIEKNRGLTRKRKKFEGHARVHNRIKYAKKLKKLSGVVRKADFSQAQNYGGEVSGIAGHVRRSQKIS